MGQVDLLSLFVLGLLGTGHCVGMCGPLVLALLSQTGKLSRHFLYHLGRVCTYTAVGVFLGGLGSGFGGLEPAAGTESLTALARLQVVFSFLAAVFMLAFGLARLGILPEPAWMSVASPSKLPGFARVRDSLLARHEKASMFLFGLLLGLLPCGLSYAAFGRALAGGGLLEGGLLTLAFGLGTVPGLLLIGTGASGWIRRHQGLTDLLSGIFMVGLAVSLAVEAIGSMILSG